MGAGEIAMTDVIGYYLSSTITIIGILFSEHPKAATIGVLINPSWVDAETQSKDLQAAATTPPGARPRGRLFRLCDEVAGGSEFLALRR